MKDWVKEETSKLSRRVEAKNRDEKACRSIEMSRVYGTDIHDLWDAVTNPERIKRWFASVEGDLKEGGKYQIQGNAGGTITRCQSPERIEVTWEYGGDVGWVNISLSPDDENNTRLTLEHISEDTDAFLEFWKKYGPGAMGVGWELGLLGLEQHLNKDGETFKPFSMSEEEWMGTEEGLGFVKASSAGWTEAAIAFGTSEADAQAAGMQIVSFYTGQEAPSED